MKLSNNGLWMGDLESLDLVVKGSLWSLEHPEHISPKAQDEEYDLLEELASEIYQTEDNVAVINVTGSLSNQDSFWNLLFGVTSYNTISTALKWALEDENITDIVMALNTNGGDVDGLADLSTNMKMVSKQKPIHAWSGGRALSAGYWISSAADKIYGTEMSEWGSIGVITTHASLARMYKEEGIDITLFRGGKYKALGHPAEPLSQEAERVLQDKTDRLYSFFLSHVSSLRPSLKVDNKDAWAEGKVFFGGEALQMGMIDGIASLNQLVDSLRAEEEEQYPGTVAGNFHSMSEGRDVTKRVILSETDQALVASGVGLENVTPLGEIDETEEVSVAEEEGTEVEAEAEEPTVEAAVEEHETEGQPSLVSYLKDELSRERSVAEELRLKLSAAESRVASLESVEEALKPLVVESINRMQVGLGQTPSDLSSLSATVLAEQYSSVRNTLFKRFPGQKNSLGAEEAPEAVSADATALRMGIVPKS